MKAFFITNVENDQAKSVGERHVALANEYGDLDAKIFEAVKGLDAPHFLEDNNINFLKPKYITKEFKQADKKQHYSKRVGVMGCFASHYSLWKKCVELNERIGIFEYDAMQVKKFPKEVKGFNGWLYLSGWRNFEGNPDDYECGPNGIHEYIGYHRWGYRNVCSGTHAYILNPAHAEIFIETAHTKGWFPVDRFMSTDLVPLRKFTICPPVFIVNESLNLSFNYTTKKISRGWWS